MSRALFYGVALVAGPVLGVLVGLAATGDDVLAWTLVLGLPPAIVCFFGWALHRRVIEIVLAAAASSVLAVVGVFAFVYYLLSAGGFS